MAPTCTIGWTKFRLIGFPLAFRALDERGDIAADANSFGPGAADWPEAGAVATANSPANTQYAIPRMDPPVGRLYPCGKSTQRL